MFYKDALFQYLKYLTLKTYTLESSFCFLSESVLGYSIKAVCFNLNLGEILVCNKIHIYSFRKYTFSFHDALSFANVSICFAKKQHFLIKIVPLLKAVV